MRTPKDLLNKTLEIGACFHRGPLLENKEGRSFLSAFEKRKKISYLEEFL